MDKIHGYKMELFNRFKGARLNGKMQALQNRICKQITVFSGETPITAGVCFSFHHLFVFEELSNKINTLVISGSKFNGKSK